MVLTDIKSKIKVVLREHYGSFSSTLEQDYENLMVRNLCHQDYEVKLEWATYNQIILELRKDITHKDIVLELQYRLTDQEDPITLCTEILTRKIGNTTPELSRLYHKVRNFET